MPRIAKIFSGTARRPAIRPRSGSDAAQGPDLEAVGARPIVCDLERVDAAALAKHLKGADAVVFAAGAGPNSGAARKESVDRAGAVLLADAAELAGARRYLLVSSMGLERVGDPELTRSSTPT
ncbi:NAD(P)H-binding protein [Kitasatospora atroaurantiaca]|uniref:NAD(P)H-binding protein n=1 Tax=Kitasatospora atroaurantiaca TaxID=285545 RepID=UPI001FE3AD96|nr:NAD(P)H-binding protein [Kitasatospora atroaurantiaca]